jgi:kinesin family member 6/9
LLLSGLSVHKAENEEQALNLLFIGDTNRVVSETPKNDASTRSHCIFIIQLEATQAGSDVKTVSRLHLVDLSGSERVGKTGVEGLLLQEARFINLSLHYLEHVIICLNKRAKGEDVHIPYRNSLMTMVLRDSLGGNCKTRMVATISAEASDMDESISTCRFAQRVALIKNAVQRNEAVDPALIIERLKKENAELRNELALLKGGESKKSLDPEEVEECQKLVEEFINNPDPGAKIILKDMIKINECFYHFKHIYNNMAKKNKDNTDTAVTNKILKDGLKMDSKPQVSDADTLGLQDEVKRLKLLIQQRDNEIMILLNLINKNKAASTLSLIRLNP